MFNETSIYSDKNHLLDTVEEEKDLRVVFVST